MNSTRLRSWILAIAALFIASGFSLWHLNFRTNTLENFTVEAWFLNFANFGFIFLIVLLISARIKLAVSTTIGLYAAIHFAHVVKLYYLEDALTPYDFGLSTMRTFAATLQGAGIALIGYAAIFLLTIIFLIFALRRFWKREPKTHSRLRFKVFMILLIGWITKSFIDPQSIHDYFFYQFNIRYGINNELNSRRLGLATDWVFRLVWMREENQAPAHYSKALIASALDSESKNSNSNTRKKITYDFLGLILLETFWDPMDYPELRVSPDPIPFFRSQMKRNHTRTIEVPGFGGGTAKAEFESLTGFDSNLISGFPYASVVHEPVASLASAMKTSGFRTIYIHAYKHWFYDRKRALPLLGFEEQWYENDIVRERNQAQCQHDQYLCDHLVYEFAQKKISARARTFMAISTYSTHGPFDRKRKNLIEFKTAFPMSSRQHRLLSQNLNLLAEADQALKNFADFHFRSNRNFLLIIYGDHIPNITYSEFDLRKKSNRSNQTRHLPWIYISNQGHFPTSEIKTLKDLSPAIAEEILTDKPVYFSALGAKRELLQYDLLHGKKYALEIKP